jgi:flagellar hook capping protein FlgD
VSPASSPAPVRAPAAATAVSAEARSRARDRYQSFSPAASAAPERPRGRMALPAMVIPAEHDNAFTIFFDDMEHGVGGWTHYATHPNGIDQWAQSTQRAGSGATSWNVSQHGFEGSEALQTPAIDLTGFGKTGLSFLHWYNFDDCEDPTFDPDGGIVEVSEVGDSLWHQITPVNGYPYVLDDICGNPLRYRNAYAHDSPGGGAFVAENFDLTPFSGKRIYIRFHSGWDCGNCAFNEGWYIDDVRVFADAAPWVRAEPTGGTVDPGDVHEVTVTYDASDLAPGDYRALLLVNSNDPDESQLTVPIHLVVADVPAELGVSPETINLGRRGQTLTCFLELTGGLDLATIDMTSLRLNRVVPCLPSPVAIGDYDSDGIPDLMVKFDFDAVRATLGLGSAVRTTLTGLVGGSSRFLAVGTPRVIGPQLLAPNGGGAVAAPGALTIRWDIPAGSAVDRADLYYSRDGGVAWTPIAAGVPGTSYVWSMPSLSTRHALVRVDLRDGSGVLAVDVSDREFAIQPGTTAVGDGSVAAAGRVLFAAPNPFSPAGGTALRFTLPAAGVVELTILNTAGQRVRVLANGWLPAGNQEILWNGRDQHGANLGPGVYFVRLRSQQRVVTTRVALLR